MSMYISMYTFNDDSDSEDHHYCSNTKRRKLGDFERHTKGSGLKLMEKMGYKGGGLGKNEQGMLYHIEVKLRPKFSGLGSNESKETPTLQTEKKSEPGGGFQPKVGRKRERALLNHKKKKEEDVYVTAEDFLANKQEQVIQKIYDMRGPEVRVYTNFCDLNAEKKAKERDFLMPELQYYIGLIVRSAEVDIQEIDRDLRNERDIAFSLKSEKENLEDEVVFQKKQLDNYEKIKSVLDRVEEEKTLGTLTLDSLAQCLRDIHKRYADEDYKLVNLSCIVCSYALPLFIRVFQGWDPLRNPSHGLELVSQWKTLLQEDDCCDIWDINISSPYADLVSDAVLPAVRISCVNTWQARDPEPMLRFLESWEKLLPSSVLAFILDNIVMPKLSSAVDAWEPRRETIPIHTWVHPWLPLLGNKLKDIHQTIRSKLSIVLDSWHPSDGSVYAILSPWKTVFDADRWQQLMHHFIVPKLKAVLKDDKFQVNPASQNLDQFYWVINWASAIPIDLMVDMMEIFFEKWLKVLYHWLCSNPNFGEVTNWYLGWKELIPKELLANQSILYKLKCGLDMMNQAIEGMEVVQPVLKEKTAAASSQQQAAASLVDAVKVDGANEMSMKELIEAYAQDHGLLFKLKPGRMHNGHQIYRFGNISIIIDSRNQKVYAQNDKTWSLETLERLLELHKRR
ncbi:unnamed protein product [Trifolium pratense]|uniref:Uncharacterized protein n=1 Tax=Trifolium pratense TaxID=57577 RepID=A0ACB0LR84_TRIPR|nr:unnamed protein product [Trifolium pratense]